ncbi:helix-turn-helix transcriptional regulator [Streptomyces sp. TRM68367]|uniref:helix-turn-helix domain-containing protein n=1 Tax=Streptomyces sp. TRM68367 TaxID=2758415 RepID=UPI00165C5D68|nr:helix-turn-helix transcriptional regulator [Streptomyces sp. TRM68367]MBC9729888.1 helix-turn-helix domain-containing protein [Streptomyces sp. TRM68367]
MMKTPSPPPEAVLIRNAQKRSGLTVGQAAEQAGIGRSRWNQIVAGYQRVGGTAVEVKAPPETLARMALVVGVTPAQLRDAGREKAAVALEEFSQTMAAPAPRVAGATLDAITALMATLTPEERDEVNRRLDRMTPKPDDQQPSAQQHREAG